MANRDFPNEYHSNLYQPVLIHCDFVIATVGPPPTATFSGRGVASVVGTGAGLSTITLTDNYVDLRCVSGIVDAALGNVDMYVQGAAYNMAAVGGATIQIRLKTGAGNATPAVGDQIFLEIVCSNSILDP